MSADTGGTVLIERTHHYPGHWTFVHVDSLTKVFADHEPPVSAEEELTGSLGETLSF